MTSTRAFPRRLLDRGSDATDEFATTRAARRNARRLTATFGRSPSTLGWLCSPARGQPGRARFHRRLVRGHADHAEALA